MRAAKRRSEARPANRETLSGKPPPPFVLDGEKAKEFFGPAPKKRLGRPPELGTVSHLHQLTQCGRVRLHDGIELRFTEKTLKEAGACASAFDDSGSRWSSNQVGSRRLLSWLRWSALRMQNWTRVARNRPSGASMHRERTTGKHKLAFVAFDSAKEKHAVAIADDGRDGEVCYLGEIDNSPDAVKKLWQN